jgi:DNA (cytosine-5)-methyltransferase 1
MRAGHLFSGAGGNLLTGCILGWDNLLAVEWDDYRCDVLEERRAEWWPGLHVHRGDARMLTASAWCGRLDLLTASWPCTDISVAGTGLGLAGEHSGLYSAARDAVRIIRPSYVFFENSPAIAYGRGLVTVLSDLASMGYDARWCVVGAAAAGAPHQRDRWWLLGCLADANDQGQLQSHRRECDIRRWPGDGAGQEIPDDWWTSQPHVVPLVHGLANRVPQIEALGDAWCPLQAALAWRLLGGPVTP